MRSLGRSIGWQNVKQKKKINLQVEKDYNDEKDEDGVAALVRKE